jgi:hypothetical protein
MSGEYKLLQEALGDGFIQTKLAFKKKWIVKFGDGTVGNNKYKKAEHKYIESTWKGLIKNVTNIENIFEELVNNWSHKKIKAGYDYCTIEKSDDYEYVIDVDFKLKHFISDKFENSKVNRYIDHLYDSEFADKLEYMEDAGDLDDEEMDDEEMDNYIRNEMDNTFRFTFTVDFSNEYELIIHCEFSTEYEEISYEEKIYKVTDNHIKQSITQTLTDYLDKV